MFFSRRYAPTLVLAALLGGALTGCGENIEGGSACPILCPDQQVAVQDTTIEPVVLDSSVTGIPGLGEEQFLAAHTIGDTVRTAVVVRFDTLGKTYLRGSETTARDVEFVENSRLFVRIDSANSVRSADIVVEAYDVDTTASDTVATALAPLFRADRLLGSVLIPKDSVLDTLGVPISSVRLLSKIRGGQRLRVGLVAKSAAPVSLRFSRDAVNRVGALEYDVSPDTVAQVEQSPYSTTPVVPTTLQNALGDYVAILKGTPVPPAGVLSVGGLPARRIYLRFDIPSRLLDSSTVVRATLQLTQLPAPSVRAGDTIQVEPYVVSASSNVTDIGRATGILESVDFFRGNTFLLPPNGSGLRELEMVQVLRRWAQRDAADYPRAIILRSAGEGGDPPEIRFYSSEAAANLRPKLKITYVPGVQFGLP